MRGLARWRLLVHVSEAASRSRLHHQRLRILGRCGGEIPGAGLSATQQLDMGREG